MVEYLRRNAGRSLELDTLEGVTIGGMEAAVATARVNAAKGSANLYLMVVRFSRNTVFRFQYALAATLSDTMMDQVKESTASLRVLTTSEATNWKPMHLEVVTRQRGYDVGLAGGANALPWVSRWNGCSH